ncbi:molybdenum cofactor guanylyltransferase MobA, partial [Bosea sp. CER48]
RLQQARAAAGTPLACAASGGQAHHAIGLWPVALRQDLRRALEAGERKISRWTQGHGAAVAEWAVDPVDPFFNVNTPEDLREAARLAALSA